MRYLVVLAALSLSACSPEGGQVCTGSDDPEALSGSYCEGAEISWDSVQLGWLDSFRTLRIRYGIDTDGGLDPRFEIQVDGLATELTVDTEISLSDYGYVRRWPGPGENAQILSDELESSSHLVFMRCLLSLPR